MSEIEHSLMALVYVAAIIGLGFLVLVAALGALVKCCKGAEPANPYRYPDEIDFDDDDELDEDEDEWEDDDFDDELDRDWDAEDDEDFDEDFDDDFDDDDEDDDFLSTNYR